MFFEDETKQYLTTVVRRVIARRGSKPVIPSVRRWVGVFVICAFNAKTREVFVMLSDRVNSRAFRSFLYRLKRYVGRGRIYLVWDNAGGHVANSVRRAAYKRGVHLVRQPPWSPHLNPVEEIWRELKISLANRLFFSLDELRDAIMSFFESKNYRVNINIDKYYP